MRMLLGFIVGIVLGGMGMYFYLNFLLPKKKP